MTLPLANIRVLDFGQVIAAPYFTQWMAWFGAEVILVESRAHFTSRATPPFSDVTDNYNSSGSFNLLNGSKKSITINLHLERGREIVLDLARKCDIVVDNFGPGVLDRFNLKYDVFRGANPSIIMLSLGAFGRSGPLSDMPGYHSAVNLFSGVADVTGYLDGHPRIMGGVIPDPLSGTFSLFAVLTALRHRRRTGEGQFIDGAMHESLIQMAPQAVINLTLNGLPPQRVGNRDWNGIVVPQGIYRCEGEDTWVAVEIHTQQQWSRLCEIIGRPEWSEAPEFRTTDARATKHDEIDQAITIWTKKRAPWIATETLQAARIPAGPVLRPDQLVNDQHLRKRGFIIETEHPVGGRRQHPSIPWAGDLNDEIIFQPAPLLGAHTNEILRELLHYDEEAIRILMEERVLE